jgi:group I intron endonuclease
MHYLIYKITNKLNNKIYVGKHRTPDRNDEYLGSGTLLGKAIMKYGKKNFSKEIIKECSSEEDMNFWEADIVNEEFVARLDTYNIMVGGQGGGKNNWDRGREILREKKHSDPAWAEELREKIKNGIRLYHQSHLGIFTGKQHSVETIKKMSAAKKGKYDGEKNPAYGTRWITNGVENKKIKKTEEIPTDWRAGRV